MIGNLPSETVQAIIEQLDKRDLVAVSETSKYLREIAVPILFETLTIRLDEDTFVVDPKKRAASLTYECQWPLQYTRSVRVVATFENAFDRRCPHHRHYRGAADYDDNRFVGGIGAQLLLILGLLKTDSLRSFSWLIGACIPHSILGEFGFLTKYQRCIEKLIVVTDGSCQDGKREPVPLHLSTLSHIESLTWSCLRDKVDLDSLNTCLRLNREHIWQLNISMDLSLAGTYGVFGDDDSFSLYDLFQLRSGHDEVYDCLRDLSISYEYYDVECKFSLKNTGANVFRALNLGGLKRLKLGNCRGIGDFLTDLGQWNQQIQLETLEIVDDGGKGRQVTADQLGSFLEQFKGLKNLYVMLAEAQGWFSVGKGALNHEKTLTHLVLHDRSLNTKPYRGYEQDSYFGDLYQVPYDAPVTLYKSIGNALRNVDSFGISGHFDYIKLALHSMDYKVNIRVLHLRISLYTQDLDNMLSSDRPSTPDDESLNLPWPRPSFSQDPFRAETDPIYGVLARDDYRDILGGQPGLLSDDPTGEKSIQQRLRSDGKHINDIPYDFSKLAHWAFGPKGLPNLKIIACGNFGHDYYCRNTRVLCRNKLAPSGYGDQDDPYWGWNFRAMDYNDASLNKLWEENQGMLQACTVDPIMPRRMVDWERI